MKEHLYFDILDDKRKQILPLLKHFKSDFYLAGGTALALQLGHRDSEDFDFFTPNSFLTQDLFHQIIAIFKNLEVKNVQEETDTLSVFAGKNIKLSFLRYPYSLNYKPLNGNYFRLASIADIGCMKLSAIVSRATMKDYIDLYFILKKLELDNLLRLTEKMLPEIERNLILKSLVFFEDIEEEPIIFKHGNKVNFSEVRSFLDAEVKKLFKQ